MDGKIRVAQIMGKLAAGGVEAVIYNYYREIDKSKIQFDFFYDADSTMAPPQDLIDMGARFYKIPPYQNLGEFIKTLRRYFRENNYQIVHSNLNTLSVFPLYAAWKEKIPVRIAHNHSVPRGKEYFRNALKYFLRIFSKVFATNYFACSQKAGRWLFGDKTFNKGRVVVINNAIDFDKFKPNPIDIQNLKIKLGIENSFIVGNVGRFTYAKNHKMIIEIFSEICKIRKDAVLVLVGDGELHNDIVESIAEMGLQDKAILVGKVYNPEAYYGLFDVFISPSFFEGLPLTTIESQIAGVPVLISAAIPEEAVISNGCKYLKLTDSPELWAKEACKASLSPVVLNSRSKEYNIKECASKLADIYLSLV